jgi:hypothetical protein
MENSHIATGRGLQRWAIPTGPAPVRAVPIDIDGRYRSRAHVAPYQPRHSVTTTRKSLPPTPGSVRAAVGTSLKAIP